MVKSYSQKLRVLYVMQILLRYSDEEHPISQAEISERLNAYGIQADRKSIYDDIKVLNEFGMEIENRRAKPSGFYVSERSFELPELKLLVDAVQSSKFITAKKSNELIRKLEELASVHEAKTLQRQVFVGNRIKTMNESIYYNVDKIHQAISQNRLIRFRYYEWTPQKEMYLRRNGKAYEISPWGLTWDDENYYMVGYDDEAEMIKHFRVDKMLDIEITDQSRSGKEHFEKFDLANYAKKVFGMFSGEERTVKMLCENALAGAMIDRFGSANVNPTVIRRLLQQLRKAEIVTVKRGSGGADIEKSLTEITLLDVYNAVEPVENGQLFHFHENPNELCPVGRNIHRIMDHRLEEIQNAMEDKMRRITIADVMADANKLIES